MKRWQDRGEVADSDEEDIELSLDSPSPERPQKRTKLNEDHEPAEDNGNNLREQPEKTNVSDDEDEIAWLSSRVATTTYGRRGKLVRPSARKRLNEDAGRNTEETEAPEAVADEEEHASLQRERQAPQQPSLEDTAPTLISEMDDAEAEHDATQISFTQYELPEIQAVGSIVTDHSRNGETAHSAAAPTPTKDLDLSADPIPTTNLFDNDDGPSGSDDDLPDPRDFFAAVPNGPGGLLPSGGSSPLSEREVSPPLPPELAVMRKPGGTGVVELDDPGDGNIGCELNHDSETDPEAQILPASTARRSLRARKEIQLHPYLIEKAKYQKQCKERGVKPVRLVQPDSQLGETQPGSPGSQGQYQNPPSSSPARAAAPARPRAADNLSAQLHYFDRADESSDADTWIDHRSSKRRKLLLGPNALKPAEAIRPQIDEFSIPPSPPQTSSDTNTPGIASRPSHIGRTATGFRFLADRSPAPLPTPNVSSSVRRTDLEDAYSSDSAPRSSRRTKASRSNRSSAVPSAPASSSSEAESEAEVEARRLRREKKRIRGVLPASWLKIDLRKQHENMQPMPTAARRRSSVSPERQQPQKGVAKRITRNHAREAGSSNAIVLSDDEAESDDSLQMLKIAPLQPRLDLNHDRFTIAPSETVDDDVMENDFVDAMLAGPYRGPRSSKKHTRQPRITDVFKRPSASRTDYSGERAARKQAGVPARHRPAGRAEHSRPPRRQRPAPVKLSIADAPRSPPLPGTRTPQFVKLALRQARRDHTRGRHSPTHKVIRLATAEDTEDAFSVLRAWREGTIAQRHEVSREAPLGPLDLSERELSDDDRRDALVELSGNARQQRFPAPTKKGPKVQARRANAKTASVRRRALHQTQLHPTVIRAESSEHAKNTTPSRVDVPSYRKPRRPPPRQPRLRNAQLETLQRDFDQDHRAEVFERRMQCLTENVALPSRRVRPSDFQLSRFLYEDGESPSMPVQRVEGNDFEKNITTPNVAHPILPHRPRKAQARRLDTEARQYRQPNEPVANVMDLEDLQPSTDFSGPVLQGLGSFGTRYSIDFDIRRLEIGTFFRSETFIGSGELRDALQICQRNLDEHRGRMRVHLDSEVLQWGAWNEEMAADFTQLPKAVSSALQTLELLPADVERNDHVRNVDQNVDYLIRSVIRYCSKCLHFVDPIDREICVESLHRLVVDLIEVIDERQTVRQIAPKVFVRIQQYTVILSKQAVQIADHHTVSHSVKGRILSQLQSVSRHLVQGSVVGHFDDLRSAYEDSHRASRRETGIGEDAWALSSVVILNHALPDEGTKNALFWRALDVAFEDNIENTCVVQDLEKTWHNMMTILPALDINDSGIVRLGAGSPQRLEDWTIAAGLLRRTFALYQDTSRVRGFTVNDYVRALLSRCHCLVAKWDWVRCEPILNTIYDFFAQRGLSFLNNEESRGSPKFLEELPLQPALDVLPDDRSFHIFLKTLASGVLGMRKHRVYPDGKIASRVWRLIPNHSRTYGKDMDLQQSDRDALRNHHDLLCTLYYGLPPSGRPKVHWMRTLVDHAKSHQGACHVNIRAWANVTSFQASTKEVVDRLAPLTEWFADIMETTIAQYKLARSEAEEDFEKARQGGADISEARLQGTVAHNQKQIAATVVDALAGLKRSLESASSVLVGKALVDGTSFWTVLQLFDASQHRLVNTMIEVLHVMEAALDVEDRFRMTEISQHSSDDSQEFGDSSALQELAYQDVSELPKDTAIVEAISAPLWTFLSNVFGADSMPDDSLLQKVVDIWVRIANATVKALDKDWLSYVDEYSSTSWSQMRDTRQKHKFTTYFMARVAEQSNIGEEVRQRVLNAWLLSLVEREATLKFQHTLTSTLLNHCSDERLLQNLPFSRHHRAGDFHVTLDEFRQRRLAVISAVLCNMREGLFETECERPRLKVEVRSAYTGMLRQLMQAMKSNYQELQADRNAETADVNVQGSYVEFVQHVVSLLQQHTQDICKVDPFFTDSNAFPLPAKDPTYVIGKLKSYVPKLRESGHQKGLASFIQTVSERAAADAQQQYLVDQLSAAMMRVPEKGDNSTPTLRHVLLTSIFPAYFANAIGTACGWIIALPLLEACGQVLADLYYEFRIDEEEGVLASAETVIAVLHSINMQCELALTHAGLLVMPHVLQILAAMFNICNSTLPLASTINRSTSHGPALLSYLTVLRSQAKDIEENLKGAMDMDRLDTGSVSATPSCPWPTTAKSAEVQAKELLIKFHAMDGQYQMQRGGASKLTEVKVQLGNHARERERLLRAIAGYCQAYDVTFIPRGRGRSRQVAWEDACGVNDVLV